MNQGVFVLSFISKCCVIFVGAWPMWPLIMGGLHGKV